MGVRWWNFEALCDPFLIVLLSEVFCGWKRLFRWQKDYQIIKFDTWCTSYDSYRRMLFQWHVEKSWLKFLVQKHDLEIFSWTGELDLSLHHVVSYDLWGWVWNTLVVSFPLVLMYNIYCCFQPWVESLVTSYEELDCSSYCLLHYPIVWHKM